MARPFLTVLVPTVVSVVAGSAALAALSGAGRLAALTVAGAVSIAVDLVVLRLAAGGIVRDGLGVLPVPERYARRIRRWLLLYARGRHRATRGRHRAIGPAAENPSGS
jgi:hypothetical protein